MKTLSKLISVTLFAIVLSTYNSYGQQEKFAGNWVINSGKSSFGTVPLWTSPQRLKLEKHGDTISLKSVFVRENSQVDSSVSNYVLGQFLTKPTSPKQIMKAKITWSENDHGYFRAADYSNPDDNKLLFKSNELWKLSTDGMELTITRNVQDLNNPKFSYTTTAVFDKQK